MILATVSSAQTFVNSFSSSQIVCSLESRRNLLKAANVTVPASAPAGPDTPAAPTTVTQALSLQG
jgi:hypothetical protein